MAKQGAGPVSRLRGALARNGVQQGDGSAGEPSGQGRITSLGTSEHLGEEGLGALVLWVGDDLAGISALDDDAFVHEDKGVSDLAGKSDLMGDDDHGHALLGERAHHVEDLAHELRVEGTRGLVEEHELRLHRERPGDRDPLLLTSRELVGVGVYLGRQPHVVQAEPGRCLSTSAFGSFFTSTGAVATFSKAVKWGNRLNRWKTMPISVRRRQTSRSRSSCRRPPRSS